VPVLTEQPAGKTGAMPIRPKIPIPITATRLAAITIGQGRMVAVVDLLVVLGSFSVPLRRRPPFIRRFDVA